MFIVVRKGGKNERDQVYNCMYEGYPKVTYTLGTKAMRVDKPLAEKVAGQLKGMFPAHDWIVMQEGQFKYTAAPPAQVNEK